MTRPLSRTLLIATVAVLASLSLWLGSQNLRLRQENSFLRTERELADITALSAEAQLKERTFVAEGMINDLGRQLRDQQNLTSLKVIVLAPPTDTLTETRAIVVWHPANATGLLTVEKLPGITDDQEYQLWINDPAYPTPVNGGLFKPGADGKAVLLIKGDKPIKNVPTFTVSLEKKGGALLAEGPVVLRSR